MPAGCFKFSCRHFAFQDANRVWMKEGQYKQFSRDHPEYNGFMQGMRNGLENLASVITFTYFIYLTTNPGLVNQKILSL